MYWPIGIQEVGFELTSTNYIDIIGVEVHGYSNVSCGWNYGSVQLTLCIRILTSFFCWEKGRDEL